MSQWQIKGADLKTGRDRTETVTARNKDTALKLGNQLGLAVETVVLIPDRPVPSMIEMPANDEVPQPIRSPRREPDDDAGYRDPWVTIGPKLTVVGPTTFSNQHLTSVTRLYQGRKLGWPVLVLLIGVVAAMMGFTQLQDRYAKGPGQFWFGAGVILVVAGIVAMVKAKRGYGLRVTASSGEHTSVWDNDDTRIGHIHRALVNAMRRSADRRAD